MKIRSLLCLAFFPLIAVSLFAFGHEGHQTIAEIARVRLTADARAEVVKILGTDDLASVATWLDDVRAAGRNRGTMKGEEEAADFNHRFPSSSKWHFVNFPVGSGRYDPNSPFASDNDIVHAIRFAIDVLEGRSAAMSKVEALRVLVHLVGDAHQPLHTVTGYYDLSETQNLRLLSPAAATVNSPMDAGGNALFFTKSQSLHELWDTGLLNHMAKDHRFQTLAMVLPRWRDNTYHVSPGDYHQWPAAWVSESIALGTRAYGGIRFGQAEVGKGRGGDVALHRIEVVLPADYISRSTEEDARAISLAGQRLASLLNEIKFAP